MKPRIESPSVDAWTAARERYIEDLSEEELVLFNKGSKATLEATLYDASAAEKLHRASGFSRHFTSELLLPFIDAIEQYSEALDVYANASPLILCPLWGSVRVILHITRKYGEFFEKTIIMFSKVGEILPRCRDYEKIFTTHRRLHLAITDLYLDILKFCTQIKAVFRKAKSPSVVSLMIFAKTSWRSFNQEFAQQLENFQNHRRSVEKEAELAHMSEEAESRALIRHRMLELEKKKQESERRRLLGVFPVVDYQGKHRSLCKLRYTGTCSWICETPSYRDWLTASQSTCLRCRGIPGSGKSVLASYIVDILAGHSSNPKPAIVYYYCDYADHQSLQVEFIVGTIVVQLLNQLKTIPENLERAILSTYGYQSKILDIDDMTNTLLAILEYLPRSFIIIDGLDECYKSVTENILGVVTSLTACPTSIIKFFISSRDDNRISEPLKMYPVIQLSASLLASDMRTYVTGAVGYRIRSGDLILRNSELEILIVTELTNKAQGMFLWVAFQIDDLCDASSDADIRRTLRDLPNGLIETYTRVLRKIKGKTDVGISSNVFKWITSAKRPLQMDELQEAVAFTIDDQCWDPDKIPDARIIKRSCRNLIVVDDDGQVHFAHHTVRQFILSTRDASNAALEHRFDLKSANDHVGGICIAYLCFSDFETQINLRRPDTQPRDAGILSSGGLAQLAGSLGLGSFGPAFFSLAYQMRGGSTEVTLPDINYSFFKKSSKDVLAPAMTQKYRLLSYVVSSWEDHTKTICSNLGASGNSFQIYTSEPLRIRSLLRNVTLEKTLAFRFRSWGANNGSDRLPFLNLFRWAVENDHAAFLDLLQHPPSGESLTSYFTDEIDHGATSLSIACSRGHLHVFYIFLNQTAAGWLLSANDGWLLKIAAAYGHLTIVQILLDRAAEKASRCWRQAQEALIFAAAGGHVAILKLFHANFQVCNIDERSVNYGHGGYNGEETALSLAATNGHPGAVRYLISIGAYIDSLDGPGLSALHIAAMKNDTATLQVLVGAGAWLDSTDRYPGEDDVRQRRAALHYTSQQGNANGTQLLLDNGASVNIKDFWGSTPLHMAAEAGDVCMVDILLKAGASVDAKDQKGNTALLLAAQNGFEAVVIVLINWRASFRGNCAHNTPLLLATRNHHFKVVDALLKGGASPMVSDSLRCSPLHIAAEEDDLPILETLLTHRADINAIDSLGKTPLLIAVEKGHESVVEALLSFGASTGIRNKAGITPLDLAIYKDHIGMMKLLVDVKAPTDRSVPLKALSIAVREKKVEKVRELLDLGVNPSYDLDQVYNMIQSGDDSWDVKELKTTLEKYMAKYLIQHKDEGAWESLKHSKQNRAHIGSLEVEARGEKC